MTQPSGQTTDLEFLARQVEPRPHFLYAYTPGSAFVRPRVRRHIKEYAEKAGWNPTTIWPGDSLYKTLVAPSLFGDRFYVCEASEFRVDDLDEVMLGIASNTFESHLCLMVSNRSRLLERASWSQACARVGVIVEPNVTMENYRSITRRLLELNDLADVQGFGEDAIFLARIKAFVQGQHRHSPFELAAEIDRIILTETDNGVVRPGRPADGNDRNGGKIGELVSRFLDDRSTASFHPLLLFIGMSLRSMNEPERLLLRLFKATAKIIAGSDRRYKRNREGNPAVLPYLIWGTMLLRTEYALCHGNFVAVFEQLCQAYHAAADEGAAWFGAPENWQDAARALVYALDDKPTALDRGREELRSALRSRVLGSSVNEMQWLLPVASEAEEKRLTLAAAELEA